VTLKNALRDWTPPKLLRALSAWRGNANRYSGDFSSWQDASAKSGGYDSDAILQRALHAALAVKNGEAAFERDSVLFAEPEFNWPVVAALFMSASRHNGELDVLDFGGALGSTYFQHLPLLGSLRRVTWSVVEQPHFVAAGRSRLQDERLRFCNSIEECLENRQPRVALLSSSIQYLPDPFAVLAALADARTEILVIDRTPFSREERHAILVQHVPAWVYEGSYPLRVFGEAPFLREMASRWRLSATHASSEGTVTSTSGLSFTYKGMLFEARP
jgi:putative methyltransferase (TIGR04325 family)